MLRNRRLHRLARGEPDLLAGSPLDIEATTARRGNARRPRMTSARRPGESGCWRNAPREPAPGHCGISHTAGPLMARRMTATPTPHRRRRVGGGRGRSQWRPSRTRVAPPGTRSPRRRVRSRPIPKSLPPDRRELETATTLRRRPARSCPDSKARTAWPWSARGAQGKSSARSSAVRWSSAWVTTNTCSPATPRPSRLTSQVAFLQDARSFA